MIQEFITTVPASDVLAAAKIFFTRRNPIYAAFLEKEGPTYLNFRGQGGEEIVIAVAPVEGGTAVRGSTYLFDQQIARFFATLAPAANAPVTPNAPNAPNAPVAPVAPGVTE